MYQHPGNDVTGVIARSEKVAGACEEVYFSHNLSFTSTMLQYRLPAAYNSEHLSNKFLETKSTFF